MAQPADRSTLERVLADRTDLDQYRHNKRLLFAAELILGLDDVHAVAGTSLTDGPGDRKCDFVHVDRAQGLVVLAQAYEATARTTVEQRKVEDLYQAVETVLTRPTGGLPPGLKSAIDDVRTAIAAGAIRKVQIWFVHNLDHQNDLAEILDGAAGAARNALDSRFAGVASEIAVESVQLSSPRLAEWFRSFETPIQVTDHIRVPTGEYLVESGPSWTAYLTTVPMEWLKQQFWAHDKWLFSGNVRGYLGKTNSPTNINNGIRATLREEPGNFWIYNNGITALVSEIRKVDGIDPGVRELEVTGLSIVNGAQTTGALHKSAQLGQLETARVLIRFIKCADPTVIRKIIRYTDRQNATMPADFRSNDRIQRRLVEEFDALEVPGYTGGRRGGADDQIRRSPAEQVSTAVAAQAMVAFHGEPGIAYHDPGKIWSDNATYHQFFNDATTAKHLLLCWGLARAIDQRRQELRVADSLSQAKRAQFDYLSRRGSTILLVTAIAGSLDALLDNCPTDRFRLQFHGGADDAIALWQPVVEAVGPWLEAKLGPLLDVGGLRRADDVTTVVKEFQTLVAPVLGDADQIRTAFAERVQVSDL